MRKRKILSSFSSIESLVSVSEVLRVFSDSLSFFFDSVSSHNVIWRKNNITIWLKLGPVGAEFLSLKLKEFWTKTKHDLSWSFCDSTEWNFVSHWGVKSLIVKCAWNYTMNQVYSRCLHSSLLILVQWKHLVKCEQFEKLGTRNMT